MIVLILILVVVFFHLRLEFPFSFFNPYLHPKCSGLERPHRRGPHTPQILSLLTLCYPVSFNLEIVAANLKASSIATTFPPPLFLETRLSRDPAISSSYRRVHPFFISQLNGKCEAAVFRQGIQAGQRGAEPGKSGAELLWEIGCGWGVELLKICRSDYADWRCVGRLFGACGVASGRSCEGCESL